MGLSLLVSTLLELGLLVLFRGRLGDLPGGPLALLWALLVMYVTHVPSLSGVRLLGRVRVTEKSILYAFFAQVRSCARSQTLSVMVVAHGTATCVCECRWRCHICPARWWWR